MVGITLTAEQIRAAPPETASASAFRGSTDYAPAQRGDQTLIPITQTD